MLTVSALTRSELGNRLATTGIQIQTGAFTTWLKTSISQVAESVGLLYADYPLLENGDFADFHVHLARPRSLRRWLRPQMEFHYNGMKPFKPLPLDHAFPVFEWGMNWCVSTHANRYLIIHAAVVEKDGHAAILPAPPGSGKSTLCAALVSKGWRLLSDELALIRLGTNTIVPLPRPISLKNKSIDIIRRYAPQATLSTPVHNTEKGTIAHLKAPRDSVARAAETARPAWIIFPKYEAGAAPQLEPIPQARAFMRVAENAFNYSPVGAEGFDTLAGLIDNCLSYNFTYSVLDDAIDVFSTLKRPDS
jgi:HprK-related kinase A